jgi:hypothetical protein
MAAGGARCLSGEFRRWVHHRQEDAMTRPTLEIVDEDAGLYAVVREAGETIGVIGPLETPDDVLAAAVARWPDIEHLDLPDALPGLWRERGGLAGLVRLDEPATTPGMVVVAQSGEPWRTRPELRWQVWPEDLEQDGDRP